MSSIDMFLPITEVCRLVGGKSARTIYRWVAEGRFPPPVSTGPNSIAWPESVVRIWIEEKKQAAA